MDGIGQLFSFIGSLGDELGNILEVQSFHACFAVRSADASRYSELSSPISSSCARSSNFMCLK